MLARWSIVGRSLRHSQLSLSNGYTSVKRHTRLPRFVSGLSHLSPARAPYGAAKANILFRRLSGVNSPMSFSLTMGRGGCRIFIGVARGKQFRFAEAQALGFEARYTHAQQVLEMEIRRRHRHHSRRSSLGRYFRVPGEQNLLRDGKRAHPGASGAPPCACGWCCRAGVS